jgi:glutamate N-acetyltransferase/amino-acid N-acetyltransferase
MFATTTRFAPLPAGAVSAAGSVTFPRGYRAEGVHSGLKRRRRDVGVLRSEVPAVSAAFYTTNRAAAAPVLLTRDEGANGAFQAVVVNAANANACTGPRGELDARRMRDLTAELLGLPPERVAVSSTGVIGEPLPMAVIEKGIRRASAGISEDGGEHFAAAIRTTDRSEKQGALSVAVRGGEVRLGFAAKGAGMIAPNMATTLCFVTCDAAVPHVDWRAMLSAGVQRSFNRITVDAQESTNDMVLGLANGASGIALRDGDVERLAEALHAGLLAMALAVVADGEGSTTTVRLRVTGADSASEAERVARAVADSPLVKTSIYGRDANWGRVVQAAGMVLSADGDGPLACDVAFDGLTIARRSMPVGLDESDELRLLEALSAPELDLSVNLHRGRSVSVVYFSDLTHEYVRVNAGART